MVKIREQNMKQEYYIVLDAGESLEIKINSVSKFNETVPATKKALVAIWLTDRTYNISEKEPPPM